MLGIQLTRRALLLGALLALAGAVVLPTVASPVGHTDNVNAAIEMEPADGPNGEYAILNADDEIELLLSGENPNLDGEGVEEDAVTPITHVFTINNTGDETADVWITDDADDVRFFHGDEPDDSLEGETNNVTLTAGDEKLSVGLIVDTRGDDDVEQIETFTVHAEDADGD
jgi:hypothetical protein